MDDFVFVARHNVRKTPSFWFEIDEYQKASGEQFLLAHIRVLEWAVSTYKQIRTEWEALRKCVTAPLFAVPENDTPKWRKFVTALGFEFLQDTICNNGASRPLFIHVIKGR